MFFLHKYYVLNAMYCILGSPVATGDFCGLSPPRHSSKLPKLKYETL